MIWFTVVSGLVAILIASWAVWGKHRGSDVSVAGMLAFAWMGVGAIILANVVGWIVQAVVAVIHAG